MEDNNISIPLRSGSTTIVSEEDYKRLDGMALCLLRGYVYIRPRGKGRRPMTSLARVLLGLRKGDPRVADHINGNTLDNRRRNLRIANRSQNTINSVVFKNNKVGLKGVCLDKKLGRPIYVAQGRYKRRVVHIGHFYTPEAAHFMYCWFARQHYEGFSRDGVLKFKEGTASIDFSEEGGETRIEIKFKAADNFSADIVKIIAAMTRLTIKCPGD